MIVIIAMRKLQCASMNEVSEDKYRTYGKFDQWWHGSERGTSQHWGPGWRSRLELQTRVVSLPEHRSDVYKFWQRAVKPNASCNETTTCQQVTAIIPQIQFQFFDDGVDVILLCMQPGCFTQGTASVCVAASWRYKCSTLRGRNTCFATQMLFTVNMASSGLATLPEL